MNEQVWSEKQYLEEWAERETVHLDFVASWETLLDVYKTLAFIDPINDEIRMTEFRWIVGETNKFLTRMHTSLMKAKDIEAAVTYLQKAFNTKEASEVKDRKTLAYSKLKQQWISRAIVQLTGIYQALTIPEGEDYGE